MIENSGLDIHEKQEEFKIGEYGGNDEVEKTFEIKIPENTKEGDYKIEVSASFETEKNSVSKNLFVECSNFESGVSRIEGKDLEIQEKVKTNYKIILFLFILFSILLIGLFGFYTLDKKGSKGSNKKRKEKT